MHIHGSMDAEYELTKKALRLMPPVPINARFARTDTVLPHGGGSDGLSPIFVAKGSRVFYSVWAMHRLPEIWGDDAEAFRPERWMNEKAPLRPGWGYLVSILSSPSAWNCRISEEGMS